MSNATRQKLASPEATSTMLAKVSQEVSQAYVEVEIEGMSLLRLLCVYYVAVREARNRGLETLRSLLRLTPAH